MPSHLFGRPMVGRLLRRRPTEALDDFEMELDAAGPSEVARRIGAWQIRPSPAPGMVAELAS